MIRTWLIVAAVAGLGFSLQATALTVTGIGAGGNIPDNNSTGITSTATITEDLTITGDLSITISGFTHTWVGDLIVTLTAPDGTTSADIMRRTGRSGAGGIGYTSDLNGNYTYEDGGADWWGASMPPGPVAPGIYAASTTGGTQVSLDTIFDGVLSGGDWTLFISDNEGLDTGQFDSWEINVTVVPVPAAVWLFGSGLIGLIGIARRKKTA